MPRLTRRRLFAAGGAGAAATALGACGKSEPESERSAEADGQILLAAAMGEASIAIVAEQAQRGLDGVEATTIGAISDSSAERGRELGTMLEEVGVEAPVPTGADDSLEGLAEAAAAAVAAYREGAAALSTPELRGMSLEHTTQVAAELAAVRGLLGEEPSPFAFVTGGSAEPYEDTELDTTADE